jgi:hypothetical protein
LHLFHTIDIRIGLVDRRRKTTPVFSRLVPIGCLSVRGKNEVDRGHIDLGNIRRRVYLCLGTCPFLSTIISAPLSRSLEPFLVIIVQILGLLGVLILGSYRTRIHTRGLGPRRFVPNYHLTVWILNFDQVSYRLLGRLSS